MNLLTAVWRFWFCGKVEVALDGAVVVAFIGMVSHLNTWPIATQALTTLELALLSTVIGMQWTLRQDGTGEICRGLLVIAEQVTG